MVRILVTREDYFAVALDLLASDGPGGLRIAELCRRLSVTTGSFYGYFSNLDGFVDAFLAFWEGQQAERMAALARLAPEDPLERIATMKALTADIPHDAEGAIRTWAATNPAVAAAQRRLDDARTGQLADVLEPVCRDRDDARRLAVLGMTLLVGLQQWMRPVSSADFALVFDQFEAMALARLALRDDS